MEAATYVHGDLTRERLREVVIADLGETSRVEAEKESKQRAIENLELLERIANIPSVGASLHRDFAMVGVLSEKLEQSDGWIFIWMRPGKLDYSWETRKARGEGRLTKTFLESCWQRGDRRFIENLGSYSREEWVEKIRSAFS